MVLSTFSPSTLCSSSKMPTGMIMNSTHQNVLYQLLGSSSAFRPLDVYILKAVPFAVAEVARLKKIRIMNTKMQSFGKGMVCSTSNVTPLLPTSLMTPEKFWPWNSS